MLELLSAPEIWERFYQYKASLACRKQFLTELRRFIDDKEYLPVCRAIESGEKFPLPAKSVISKKGSAKKRVVYTYPPRENTVLKLLTYLLLRKYDGVFSNNLYSFRPGRSAKDAIRCLLGVPEIENMYAYKVDISNYFNSIDTKAFTRILEKVVGDDSELYAFLKSLLEEPYVSENGEIKEESKGIMAGTPLSAFYANLYLKDMDEFFCKNRIPYARYSDDIIVFSKSRSELDEYAAYIGNRLRDSGLSVNSDKEFFSDAGKEWTFLGFSCTGKTVDIAPVSVKKLKDKMRRKRDALMRWRKRNGIDGDRAAKAFIRIFNRKLFEAPSDNELSWSLWFFPVISTSKSLKEIDLYAVDCVRYLIAGKHTKARFGVKYETVRSLGFKSLVHEYYNTKQQQ